MNIHEYQAKAVLREFGVPVPRGIVAFSAAEAVTAAKELGGPVWVVKAQIHAGGRGKAGGVKVVRSLDDVGREAERLIGSTLVTHQTGPQGRDVKRVYVEAASDIARELYLALSVDRTSGRTTAGGARQLYADPPIDGRVVLDFNKAVNLPCAYIPYATCPLAPPQNRLSLAIEAGELKYEPLRADASPAASHP